MGFTAAAIAGAVLLAGCVLGKTGDPHLVTDTSAELHGTLAVSAAGDVEFTFEWGPTTDYGSSFGGSAHVDPGPGKLFKGMVAGDRVETRPGAVPARRGQPRHRRIRATSLLAIEDQGPPGGGDDRLRGQFTDLR